MPEWAEREDKIMNDTTITLTKVGIVAILTTFFRGAWALLIPAEVLVICMVIDYATGIMAARYRDEVVTSEKSSKGIIKKISMLILVIVGIITDLLIVYAVQGMGLVLPFAYNCFISCIICLWLVCNELISITENLRDMESPIPVFMLPLLKLIRKTAEKTVKTEEDEHGNHD